jgi:hypothetical protein
MKQKSSILSGMKNPFSLYVKEDRMKKTFLITAMLGALILAAIPAASQDIQDFVSKYTADNGKGYMQPLADAFGASLNSGLFHSAHISRAGFHLYVGVETMTAIVGDKQKTFTAKTENFNPQTSIKAPTLFGSNKSVSVAGENPDGTPNGTAFYFPGGMNVKNLPILAPQVTVGSVMGTDATVRWFATSSVKDIGKIELLGWGVRHSLSQYMPLLPMVDIAVGYYSQSFKVGKIVDAKATLISLQGSVSKSILVVYGGIGYESSSLKIAYDYKDAQNVTQTIKFDLDGVNKVRLTVGVGLNLPGVKIHADYNIATQNVLALGVGFGI